MALYFSQSVHAQKTRRPFDWSRPFRRLDLEAALTIRRLILKVNDSQARGFGHPLKLHLSPDNSLLLVGSGQQIDQTDFGLLIDNISRSLTDQRRGALDITEEVGHVRISVLAENHFRKGL